MKRLSKLFIFAAIVAAFAVPALAQSKDCTDENKGAWYQKFLDNYKGNQKVAYDTAKQYLACWDVPDDQIGQYLKKFVVAYDEVQEAQALNQQFKDAFEQKKYADQLKFGKQILAKKPDSAGVYIILGLAGLGDASVLSESAQYAKKAIELIEAGKPFAPVASKDQALAYLNYNIAKATVASSPSDAIPYFVKAAKYDSDLKKNPQVYNELAAAYGAGPVAKLADDYKPFVGKPETTESKLVLANLNQAIDRQIDAFARAAALSTNPTDKNAIMDVLTGLYKDRNKSEAGLNELVANVLSKPLPEMPTPITTLPTTSTPSSGTPTSGGSPGTNGGAGSSGGAKNGNSSTTGQTKTTTSTTGTQTGSTKPSPSPTPRPKQRRSNHRVGI